MRTDIPMLTITLDYMKMTLKAALTDYWDQINKTTQSMVDQFCTPENLKTIIDKQVKELLPQVIRGELEYYFKYGPGSNAIKKSISETMNVRLDDNVAIIPRRPLTDDEKIRLDKYLSGETDRGL